VGDDSGSQLSLFLERGSAATDARRAMRLVVMRGRGHLWARPREPGVIAWTFSDLMDRVRLLGFLRASGEEVRDDDAALWAAAAELARQSPFSVRIAPDLATLYRSLLHEAADGAALRSHLEGDGGRHDELASLFGQVAQVGARLREASVIDGASALARGVRAVEAGQLPPSLTVFTEILVEDPIDMLPLEVSALVALARAGLPMRVRLPRVEGHDGLTEGIHWISNAIEGAHDAPALELEHEPLGGQGALRRVVDAWYRGRTLLDGAEVAPARVELLADPVDEARRVAGVVARWRREEGPARVAVALRTLDAQADRVRDALRSHGVPVRTHRGALLADVPASRVLLNVLRARRQGAPRELVLGVLASPAFKGALPPERAGALARVLRRAVARTDVEDATRPEGGYRHRLERFASGRSDVAEAERVRAAIDDVERVLALTRTVPPRASLGHYLDLCRALVEEQTLDDEEGGRDRLLEVLDRWAASLARVAPDGTQEVALAAFLRLLERSLSQRRVAPEREPDDTAVELVSLPELFGREYDFVAIVGCVHGRMPLAERGDPLLSDADRALVNRAFGRRVLRMQAPDALDLAPVPARQALEPLWFLGALASARRGLLVTAPAREGGRDVAPSEFLQEMLLATGADADARAGGPMFEEDPHPRLSRLVLAQRVARRLDPGAPDDDPDVQRARLLADVSRQRIRFFARGADEDVRDVADAFAFRLDPARVLARFGRQLGVSEDKPLPPTRLESIAYCRMQGFVEQLLRVDTDREGGQDADARVLGTIAHRALEHFFRERRDADVSPERMEPADRARLREIVDSQAASFLEGGEATGHLHALRANVAWLKQSLVRTVTALARDPPVRGAKPRFFEMKVGTRGWQKDGGLPPLALTIGGRRLYFGGEIDRVDESEGRRVVVDYKHSTRWGVYKKLKPEALLESHFQLPLYLRLLEQGDLKTDEETELLAYLVSLRDAVATPPIGSGGVLRRRLFGDGATSLAGAIDRVLSPVFDGVVPPDVGERCTYCRMQRVCRVPLASEQPLGGEGT
jgi:hypothetical protein